MDAIYKNPGFPQSLSHTNRKNYTASFGVIYGHTASIFCVTFVSVFPKGRAQRLLHTHRRAHTFVISNTTASKSSSLPQTLKSATISAEIRRKLVVNKEKL